MSLFEGFDRIRLVRIGPSMSDRLQRWVAAHHHKSVIARLRDFRVDLTCEMLPELWTVVEAPVVTFLADVCYALGLNEKELAVVLGREGERALAEILESRPVPRSYASLSKRQAKALHYVRRRGSITNRQYQHLCPEVSAETLRLHLVDLVARGLLIKNGTKRGTRYMLPE